MTIGQTQPAAAEAKRRWYRVTPDRLVWLLLVVEGLLWLAERFGCFPKGYAVLLAVASVALAMLVMLLWFAASLVFRWRFQFSIGSLLVLAVVVAVACGWFASAINGAKEQEKAVAGIERSKGLAGYGGYVGYDYQGYEYDDELPLDPYFSPQPGPRSEPGPAWLRRVLGKDFLSDVARADVGGDEGIAYLRCLPGPRALGLFNVTDDGIGSIPAFHQVRSVWLSHITRKFVVKLNELSALEGVHAHEATDFELEELKALPRLKRLDLFTSKTSDAGLKQIRELSELQLLNLAATHITDSVSVHGAA